MRSQAILGLLLLLGAGCESQPAGPLTYDEAPEGYVLATEHAKLQSRFDALVGTKETTQEVAPESDSFSHFGLPFIPSTAKPMSYAACWLYDCPTHPTIRLVEYREWPELPPTQDQFKQSHAAYLKLPLMSMHTEVSLDGGKTWAEHGVYLTTYDRGVSFAVKELGKTYSGKDEMGIALPPREFEVDEYMSKRGR